MFPEDALFGHVLAILADALASFTAPVMNPMPSDRWIARSLLQKACRRGEVELAWRALASLLAEDRYGIWRALTIIAMEDVGVPGFDVFASVVAAGQDRRWRTAHGGEWVVASYLVQQMCESPHCQAVCDLLLRATNDPVLSTTRADALDAAVAELIAWLDPGSHPIEHAGMAALAIGGGLAEGQKNRDPYGLFDALAERGFSPQVVATCRVAWRISRNEMALLLPLVWGEWAGSEEAETVDDHLPPVTMIGELPGYAIDQFTRAGGQVTRALLKQEPALRRLLDAATIPASRQPHVVGDLIFLLEGTALSRRTIWPLADQLRQPHRLLNAVADLRDAILPALSIIVSKGSRDRSTS